MKKYNYRKFVVIQKKRERKRLKRLLKNKKYNNPFIHESKLIRDQKNADDRNLKNFNFELDLFLSEQEKVDYKTKKYIEIPTIFSLEENYEETIFTINVIRKSLMQYIGNDFMIDFSKCNIAEFSALFLLKVIVEEYLKELKKLDKKLLVFKAYPNIKIKHSENEKVNLVLLSNSIIKNATSTTTDFVPVSIHNMILGRKSQKSYHENKKGLAVTSLRNYINSCLKRHGFELNEHGERYFDGLISEILNNAEDHSKFDSWYAFANIFESKNSMILNTFVSEINFSFLNFGYSIYEGFEITKDLNIETYSNMEKLFDIIIKNSKENFSKEEMFTLYSLQEGNSRLKFEKESRGTGTMKFINSFLNLGDYQDNSKGFIPRLLIYSGHTKLKCDNEYKPFIIDGVYYLSLNNEKDMLKAPCKSHLSNLQNKFPGTLITGKIYLNEDHLKTKLNNGN